MLGVFSGMPAVAAAGPQPELKVVTQSRFGGDSNGDGVLDSSPDAPADALRIDRVPAQITATPCRPGQRVAWVVDGATQPSTGCRLDATLDSAAEHQLSARVAGGAPIQKTFRVDDRLVVAIGDSVASGEGNPDLQHKWLEKRCHRSAAAGFEQAARLLAQSNPGVSLTFVSLACSGATVPKGLTGPYDGIEKQKRGTLQLTPQLDRLDTIATVRHVGAVLMSVGANDVNFGPVARHCALVANCPTSTFDPDKTGRKDSADAVEGLALARLGARYDTVATRLNLLVGRKELTPGNVLVSEYFDPTRDAKGNTCPRILFAPGVELSKAELQWAESAVLIPLNQELSAAARRHDWQLVGGISSDFATHGYCTGGANRWVVRFTESLPNSAGPLHPNQAGHYDIADRVAPMLATSLALTPPPPHKAGAPSEFPWWGWLVIVGAVLIAVFVVEDWRDGFFGWVRRTSYLPRSSRLTDPFEAQPAGPSLQTLVPSPDLSAPKAFVDLMAKAGGLLVGGIFSLSFVAFVGAALVWVRFWAARFPVDQAVGSVGRGELLAIGASALLLFGILAAIAVVAMWALDGEASATRTTRRALAVLIVAELGAGLLIGHYRPRQAWELILGFVVAVALLLVVVEVGIVVVQRLRSKQRNESFAYARGLYFRPTREHESRARHVVRFVWQLIPLLILVAAFVVACVIDGADNRTALVFLPILLAWILFVAPGGVAGAAEEPHARSLTVPRASVAAVLLACLMAFLVKDEWWLAGAAFTAFALAGICLVVAKASGKRFLPFAVAVFFSVGIYGAVASCLRTIDSPQAQPAAVLLKNGEAVCGVWVGDGGGKVRIAHVQLSERGARRRPAPRRSRLAEFPDSQVVDRTVGPLQSVGHAQDQAVVLRDTLEQENTGQTWHDTGSGCEERLAPVQLKDTAERTLAKKVQPELIVDRKDGFWPVPVRTLFSMEDRRARVCRRVSDGTCVRLRSQGDLPWTGGEGEWLDYPADAFHTRDEHEDMIDALGSADPQRSAREYFLVTRSAGPAAPWTVQFWFFYTFNYLQVAKSITDYLPGVAINGGYHEGDWESVSMLLSAKTQQPRYVWMSRHKNEGRAFVWGEDALQQAGGRLRVFAARGSHADYENCSRQQRVDAPAGLIDDRPQCDFNEQLHLPPETTPLTDISRTSWACWHGLFGSHPSGHVLDKVPYESDNGPLGPLWQQTFGGVSFEPCRGVADPGLRDGRSEEVLSDSVSKQLTSGSGTLDAQFDGCGDWEKPITSGAYIVACDSGQLRKYFQSGLETLGTAGIHIDSVDPRHPQVGATTLPALRRDPNEHLLDNWRVAAAQRATTDIYASCQAGRGSIEVHFTGVQLEPNTPLRVDDRDRARWRLRDELGRTVASAPPHVVRKLADKQPVACS